MNERTNVSSAFRFLFPALPSGQPTSTTSSLPNTDDAWHRHLGTPAPTARLPSHRCPHHHLLLLAHRHHCYHQGCAGEWCMPQSSRWGTGDGFPSATTVFIHQDGHSRLFAFQEAHCLGHQRERNRDSGSYLFFVFDSWCCWMSIGAKVEIEEPEFFHLYYKSGVPNPRLRPTTRLRSVSNQDV